MGNAQQIEVWSRAAKKASKLQEKLKIDRY